MAKNFKILIFIFVFSLGVFLRLWKYPFYPPVGHAEEYLFVWSGLSLIEKGVPISWSDIAFEETEIFWEGVAPHPEGEGGLGVSLKKPWLDQPPLFSLMVGGMAKIYNLPNFTLISPYVIRIPSLLFSFITMIFIFLLSKKFFGYWLGILSLLIYGTVPVIVFGSRLAVPENMITTLIVVSLWLIMDYLKTEKKWKRNLAVFLGVLAGLAKPTGFFLVPFVVFLLWRDKRWKEGIKAGIIGAISFFTTYFAYGFYFNRELFLKVLLLQSRRPAGWSSLSFLITNPGFSVEVILDGFLVLGFLALAWLVLKKKTKNEEVILLSFIYWLLVFMISGGRHDQLAWYRYPIYPFMSITTALLVKEIFINPSLFSSALFIPLVLTNADLLENPFWRVKFFIDVRFYRLAFAFLLAPSIFQFFSKKEVWLKLSRLVIVIVFIAGIFFNIWVVKSWFNLLCDHTLCPLPQKINLLKPAIFK